MGKFQLEIRAIYGFAIWDSIKGHFLGGQGAGRRKGRAKEYYSLTVFSHFLILYFCFGLLSTLNNQRINQTSSKYYYSFKTTH